MSEECGAHREAATPREDVNPHNWRVKLRDRDEMLKYLRSGERYWFSDDWYGSERRRNPA